MLATACENCKLNYFNLRDFKVLYNLKSINTLSNVYNGYGKYTY